MSAAEEVGAGAPVGHGQAARLIAGLVDKSLVQAEDSATGTRYRLLEAVKAFALEQLVASGELEEVRARHGTYFADLGERMASRLHGRGQGLWVSRLDQDQQGDIDRAQLQWGQPLAELRQGGGGGTTQYVACELQQGFLQRFGRSRFHGAYGNGISYMIEL